MKQLILLLVIVLIAGCTNVPGFGGDVVKINQEVKEEGDRDIVIIKDVKTIPTSPVLPDQDVQLSFIIENVDAIKEVKINSINLFDAPLFKDKNGNQCNLNDACKPVNSDNTPFDFNSVLLPKEQRLVRFDLKSPASDEIGNLKTKVKLNFKISYSADTTLVFQVPLVNLNEIKSKQLSGETLSLNVKKTYGPGPLQPDVELFGSPYILAGQPATLIFSVVNKGKGKIATEDNNKIKQGSLKIKLDQFITPTAQQSALSCSSSECSNQRFLELYKDKTLPLRLETKSSQLTNEPFKTLKIDAVVSYSYEFRDSIEIETSPYGG